jgi:hypothetical protein
MASTTIKNKIMKKIIITLGLLITLTSSCQNKKEKTMQTATTTEQFDWVEVVNAPQGYPIEVYRGGFILKNGRSVGMFSGPTHVEWGGGNGGMNSGVKPLPVRLNVIWVSFRERCLYEIDCALDYDKILDLFNEGYQDSAFFFNKKGTYKKVTYDEIKAGFLPGGGVVIWVEGAGKQVEVGRYQGHKTTVSQKEIDGLDNHDQLFFSQDYYTSILNNPKVVPPEMQEALKNKPISFDLWDTYREKYSWKPTFISKQEGFVVKEVYMEMFNGEKEELFDQSLVKNEFKKRAVIKKINFVWQDITGQAYGGNIDFDETEVFDAYQEIYKDNKNAEVEIEFRVNIPNNYVVAFLKGNGKEIGINLKTKVRVFESRKKY